MTPRPDEPARVPGRPEPAHEAEPAPEAASAPEAEPAPEAAPASEIAPVPGVPAAPPGETTGGTPGERAGGLLPETPGGHERPEAAGGGPDAGEAAQREARRRRRDRLARAFGDAGDHDGGDAHDRWLRSQIPPHHGG